MPHYYLRVYADVEDDIMIGGGYKDISNNPFNTTRKPDYKDRTYSKPKFQQQTKQETPEIGLNIYKPPRPITQYTNMVHPISGLTHQMV